MSRVILETPRLQLREMIESDLDFLAAMLGDPEVMRFYPKPLTREEAREWLERQWSRYAEYGHGGWLALDRANGESVGQISLVMQEVDGVMEPEIGYILHRPFWRRGLATEGALAVKRHAFEERGYDHVISLVRPVNIPSQGVARKLGMTPVREAMFRGYNHFVFTVHRDG